MYSLLKKALAEGLGTFVLVFFACGTAMLTANIVAVALAFGLVIVAMAFSIGHISGCHINPAVSLGMLIARKMNVKEFLFYILAQFIGATVGALLLFLLLKISGISPYIGATNAIPATATQWEGYLGGALFEVILTFVFVFAILGVTSKTENKSVAGIVIGLTLTLVHLIGINITGTSVNPARSFGPAIASFIFDNNVTEPLKELWVFIAAPLAGGALAAIVFSFLDKAKSAKDEKKQQAKVQKKQPVKK